MTYKLMSCEKLSKQLNDITYTDYFNRISGMARTVYRWENLPNNINGEWIERFLFTEGECIFFKDDTLGFMVTKVTASGVNAYDEPIDLRPTANNYTNLNTYQNNVDAVLIKNNADGIPSIATVELFSMRLANITRAIDVNVDQQKTSTLIICDEKQRLSLKRVYQQWAGNEPVIYGDKLLSSTPIQALKTDAPIVFDKLQLQKNAILNECYTFLGINNSNQDKRERLVADEVSANDEQIEAHAERMYSARKRACDMINKLFGLNVSVSRTIKGKSEVKENEC